MWHLFYTFKLPFSTDKALSAIISVKQKGVMMLLCMTFMVISQLAYLSILKLEQLQLQNFKLAQHHEQADILYHMSQQFETEQFQSQLPLLEKTIQSKLDALFLNQVKYLDILDTQLLQPQLYLLTIQTKEQAPSYVLLEQEVYLSQFYYEQVKFEHIQLYGWIDKANRHHTLLEPLPSHPLIEDLNHKDYLLTNHHQENSQLSWQPDLQLQEVLAFNLGTVKRHQNANTIYYQIEIDSTHSYKKKKPIIEIAYLIRSHLYYFEPINK